MPEDRVEEADFSRLVVFDTNTVEGRYLAPLLRGEKCHDLELLRTANPPYMHAIYVKSYYETCQHAEVGRTEL